jgi:4-cresol dehydrogenase (hydroxylating)
MEQITILPPGVSLGNFRKAIAEFRKIVGDDYVVVTPERIVPYTKIMTPGKDADHTPAGAIMPASVEEVQKIVAVCNKYKVPVWPVSTGRNFGYGGAAPATPGQVVLDLKRMNRIIEIDPELCTALLEPGVTYQQLVDYIEEHNLPLWVDCPAIGPITGPVGNTLDRGVGYTPYGEHFMFSCGMEVVLANGEVLRTGMGSLPKSNTWQVFKWGYGPYLDGIFTQSNFGIVTKLGLWLMPKPPVYKPFMVRYSNEEDIVKIIDALRPLRIANIIPNALMMMHAMYEIPMYKRRSEVYPQEGPIPIDVVKKHAKELGLGIWNAYFALYGTEEQVAANEKIIRAAIAPTGGEILTENEAKGNRLFHHHKELMCGQMNLEEFGVHMWRGAGGGSAWFAPVAQAKGHEAEKQLVMAKKVLDKHGLDYLAGFIIGWRDLHHIINVAFDRTDPADTRRGHECFNELIDDFAAEGYGSYRTNIDFMDKVAATFGKTPMKVNEAIKRALDPNGIIAPGKSGIHLRRPA